MHGPAVVGEPERARRRRSSAISVSASPPSSRVIEAMKPTGTRASRRAASRSERSTGAESTVGSVLGIATTATYPPAAAARVPESRSSLCSWPGRAQVHVRVDEGGEQVAALAVEHLGAVGRLERAGRADLGDLAAAHEDVVRRVDPGARVEHVGAADEQVGRRLLAMVEHAHAPAPAGVAGGAVRRGAARQQLVQDRHPHDHAGRDLLADDRLRGVDHLGGELHARG